MSQIHRHAEDRFSKPPSEPGQWMQDWIAQARDAGLVEPTAMNLATADCSGRLSNRVVLFKGMDQQRLCFYTNYEGHKAEQIMATSQAAICFWWDRLDRQLRVEGRVEKLSAEQSDAYFSSRPRGSQIGAWASAQSRPIDDRRALEQQFADIEARFAGQEVPRPPHWGGFGLRPEIVEFWQGQSNRFHDRMQYRRDHGLWQHQRLQP